MKKIICYVDESEGDIISFVTRMNSTSLFAAEYIQIVDGMTLDSLMEDLYTRQFHCLVVDYFLKQEARVDFQGDEVVAAYRKRFPRFPILMLSNKDDGAIEQSENIDVTIIRSKREYADNPDLFTARLQKMIDDYQDELSRKSGELANLKRKESNGNLNANEEERLIELDAFLDESLDSSDKIPNAIRESSNAERLDTLIARADTIIEKIKKDHNE